MTNQRALIGVLAAAGLAQGATAAVSISSVEDEQFSTIFDDTGGPSVAGSIYAPSLAQNPIGSVATFSAKGAVAFLQAGEYYLAGNNVAWGFSGAQRADVVFAEGVESVSIAARGTAAGDVVGSGAAFPFGPGETLSEADAFAWALDSFGNFIPGSQTPIQNLSLRGSEIDEIDYLASDLGQSIYGVAFVQNADDSSAGVLVGGLGFTVPTPGSAALLGLGGLAAARRRRR